MKIEVICNGCELVQVIDGESTCPRCGATSFTFIRFADKEVQQVKIPMFKGYNEVSIKN